MRSLTTMQTPVQADNIIYLTSHQQLTALVEQLSPPFVVLGEGSNVVFVGDYSGTVVVNQLPGVTIIDDNESTVTVLAGAGENWHHFVCQMAAAGYHGLENLALIPGTVGAAPVQNIGAYGVEVCEFIDWVDAFDWVEKKWVKLSADACQFGYRDSLFKQTAQPDRYLITAVAFTLKKTFEPVLTYREVNAWFAEQPPQDGNALLSAIVSIRQAKLPDYRCTPNAGSFFKNPVISGAQYRLLQANYPQIPGFLQPITHAMPENSGTDNSEPNVKIPAAWLIEQIGFKGMVKETGAGVYEKHALILVNTGQATGKAIYDLAQEIRQSVAKTFTINLLPEVRFIGDFGGEFEGEFGRNVG
ncbi:UDP-N-acetylmuramate dehydrogenase [Ostreibacterium oceani]|uniref:UDP-N-acetylenolpyruvoylglucosamine reductase n=1 Tax=Ostreibacterium oceani TaxID=2654998 RepID=A0A6N7EXX4_9GAMM|nr:UDP-N-acetylmuramate dehydrogenase [Ostreibacterium oceani]MPV86239.1 UDP-N-acetylmuramate dehydrogenase [Ostreibacterium oceani]